MLSLFSDDFENDTVSSQSSEAGDNPDSNLFFPQQLGLMKLKNVEGRNSRRESQDVQETSHPKRYLQCPAVVSILHLKKFIRLKHDLTSKMQVRTFFIYNLLAGSMCSAEDVEYRFFPPTY